MLTTLLPRSTTSSRPLARLITRTGLLIGISSMTTSAIRRRVATKSSSASSRPVRSTPMHSRKRRWNRRTCRSRVASVTSASSSRTSGLTSASCRRAVNRQASVTTLRRFRNSTLRCTTSLLTWSIRGRWSSASVRRNISTFLNPSSPVRPASVPRSTGFRNMMLPPSLRRCISSNPGYRRMPTWFSRRS